MHSSNVKPATAPWRPQVQRGSRNPADPWLLVEDGHGLVVQGQCVSYRDTGEWQRVRDVKVEVGTITIQAVRELNHWRVEVTWPGNHFTGHLDDAGACALCERPIIDVVVGADGRVLIRH